MAIFNLGDLTDQSVQQSDSVSSTIDVFTDIYKFSTAAASDIEIDLTNTSTITSIGGIFGGIGVFDTLRLNINLTLFSDSNGNGFLDVEDETLAASLSTDDGADGQDEFIRYSGAAGSYFAFVQAAEESIVGGTYDLNISVNSLPESAPVVPTDGPEEIPNEPIEVLPVVASRSDNPSPNSFFGTVESDTIFATDLDDIIVSDTEGDVGGGDAIFAGLGNDLALGGVGSDVVFGGVGSDLIFGGIGDDFIVGGAGNDLLYGGTTAGEGAGSDIFVFGLGEGVDVVLDFETGIDAIGLTDGLSFGQIYVAQAGQDTVIGTAFSGELLAVLTNVVASDLSEQAFISVS